MCGILGEFTFRGAFVDPRFIFAGTDVIRHRGPDEEGYFFATAGGEHTGRITSRSGVGQTDYVLGFGHRRLSIIDLKSGQQPMTNEDGTVWIDFNGEAYNYQDLQPMLEARGHVFRTHCDTETILHLYEFFGTDCVQYLRGMFAFAIWDTRKNQLFLARDPVGIKPLYYYLDQERLIFASELKGILAHPTVKREVDPLALCDYLMFNYVPAPRTMLKGIYKLPPAHSALVTADGEMTVSRYWQFHFEELYQKNVKSETEYAEELRAHLSEAVTMQMVSDVPLGAFLSGGIDSNSVAALMSLANQGPVKTFTVRFEGAPDNESDLARLTAQRYHTDHHEITVRPDFLQVLPDLVHQFDEPLGNSSLIPTYYVAHAAREHVTVALSGDGGDESYAGYTRYQYHLGLHRLDLLPQAVRQPLFRALSGSLPRGIKGRNLLYRLSLSPSERYVDYLSGISGLDRVSMLTPDARALMHSADSEYFRSVWSDDSALDALSQMQYVDIHSYLSEDILVKVDRASMLTSLEVRVPLLDHKLLEFAATISPSLRLKDGTSKYILKRAMRDLLPDEILHKSKQGFGAPLNQWFREELTDFVRSVLLDDRARQRSIIDPEFVTHLLDWHKRKLCDYSITIWMLLALELWFRAYIDDVVIVN